MLRDHEVVVTGEHKPIRVLFGIQGVGHQDQGVEELGFRV